jgi:hypothetical protein
MFSNSYMSQSQIASTPYPAVNSLLDGLLVDVRSILGDELIGFYLDGSLALGDFDPATSDVDFIAAITRPLSSDTFDALAAMHRAQRDSGLPFAWDVEGSYIHLSALRRHDPADAIFPNLERGTEEFLKRKEHHSDWVIHRSIVREHGITLFGPPPASLIDPVSPDEIRAATAGVLRSWWGTAGAITYLRDAPLMTMALYVVPTMCRALYGLEQGGVLSKPAACRWALATQDARWQPLIGATLRHELPEPMRNELLALVHHVVGRGSQAS